MLIVAGSGDLSEKEETEMKILKVKLVRSSVL